MRIVTEKEFRDDLPKILDAMDQPTIDGLNTWFVSKAARESGLKVAISGLGGDELFGGYPSFRDIPRWVRTLAIPAQMPGLGNVAQRILTGIGQLFPVFSPKAAGLLKYGGTYPGAYLLRRGVFMPWELEPILGGDMTQLGLRRLEPLRHIGRLLHDGPKSAFAKIAVLESSFYMRNQLLRDTDWASMAHSLEVRVPLVDPELLRGIAAVSTGRVAASKRALANSPRFPLPRKVIERSKTGFTTPIQTWLQRDTRIQRWRKSPSLAIKNCAWVRRWAFEVAVA
jgi:asparagine synthase (glutamine-hydrolysing)